MADQSMSIRELFMAMPAYANPAAIQQVEKTVQFMVTGAEEGAYVLEVKNGEVTVREGIAMRPDATITTPADVWIEISTGAMNGAVAFMTGKFKATGDLSLLMAMQNWFTLPG